MLTATTARALARARFLRGLNVAPAAPAGAYASSHAPRSRPPAAATSAEVSSYDLAEQIKKLVEPRSGGRRSKQQDPATAAPGTSKAAQGLSESANRWAPALHLIRTAPPSAATVVVWNTLLNSILGAPASSHPGHSGDDGDARRVLQAYQVWMEMKRRGVVPTSRSYGTFLTGVARCAKRALATAQHRRGRNRGAAAAAKGWNADLRAKVETVHRQWRAHCDRVLSAPPSSSRATSNAPAPDGRDDTLDSLSPVPTDQYLSFLSAALSLSLPAPTVNVTGSAASPAPQAYAPAGTILHHLVETFDAMPTPGGEEVGSGSVSGLHSLSPSPLGRTSVSYAVVFGALQTALQASESVAERALGATAAEEGEHAGFPDETEAIEGLRRIAGEHAPNSSDEDVLPTPRQILERALAMWDHLVLHPPQPAPSSSLSNPPPPRRTSTLSTSTPLSAVVPTALLSLYLSASRSTAASLPPTTHKRFLEIPQRAFGFVEPSRIAELEEADAGAAAVRPLCLRGGRGGSEGGEEGAGMDSAAFGAALRVASRAPRLAGEGGGAARWAVSWWDQVQDYPARFGLARGVGGGGAGAVGEESLRDREAVEVLIKAAGRSGDIETIEDLLTYLKSTAESHPAQCAASHTPLVSTYTLAIAAYSRIGTQAALSAAIRTWREVLRAAPPFNPPASGAVRPRQVAAPGPGADGEETGGVAKRAYAQAAYEIVRMAVMGVRERTAVWSAVSTVAGLDTGAGAAGDASTRSRGAFHPDNFPSPAAAAAAAAATTSASASAPASPAATSRLHSAREYDALLARMLHNALGRILAGDGRPGDLSAQLGAERARELREWRERIKRAYLLGPEKQGREASDERGREQSRERTRPTEVGSRPTGRDSRAAPRSESPRRHSIDDGYDRRPERSSPPYRERSYGGRKEEGREDERRRGAYRKSRDDGGRDYDRGQRWDRRQ